MHNPLSLSPHQGKTIAFSSWNTSTNNTKSMPVKFVHPGGHIELHNRPVLAAEILLRNPGFCVAHPNVYKQPWMAIVSPDTTLMPGQKFYVVSEVTIRRLQRCSLRYSPCMVRKIRTSCRSGKLNEEDDTVVFTSTCSFFMNKKNSPKKEMKKDGHCSFTWLIRVIKIKTKSKDSIKKTRSSSSWGSSETRVQMRKRTEESTKGFKSFDHWEPSLESISEE